MALGLGCGAPVQSGVARPSRTSNAVVRAPGSPAVPGPRAVWTSLFAKKLISAVCAACGWKTEKSAAFRPSVNRFATKGVASFGFVGKLSALRNGANAVATVLFPKAFSTKVATVLPTVSATSGGMVPRGFANDFASSAATV